MTTKPTTPSSQYMPGSSSRFHDIFFCGYSWILDVAMEIFQTSTIARFSIAVIISSLITSATFLPLVFHLAPSVPVVRARPQAAVVPPSVLGIYPDPEPCHGNCSWVHDPSIVYDDHKYWRFTTSGNIAISTSRFLQGPWTYQGALLHNGTSIHLRDDQDIWV